MTRTILDNADLWIGNGDGGRGYVVVNDNTIEAVQFGSYSGSGHRIDLCGASLSPGLIDLMVLGGFGKSILRDDPLAIARGYLGHGVTAIQFCSGILPWQTMRMIAGKLSDARAALPMDCARIVGWYLEGPFQRVGSTGANLEEYVLPPSLHNVHQLFDEVGHVLSMINVSPGVDGDVEAIRVLSREIPVTMAHSNVPAERVLACVEAGTSILGHVWDNNSGLIGDSGVQQPTLEHVALTDERVRFIHMICDGVHVHPIMLQLTLRCRGFESICLVTDAMPSTGTPDGPFQWDDGRTFVKVAPVARTMQGNLCGSTIPLAEHFRNFVHFTGLAPRQAIRTVTLNPAMCVGIDQEIGLLAPGRSADLVAWNDQLEVKHVWRMGREVPLASKSTPD